MTLGSGALTNSCYKRAIVCASVDQLSIFFLDKLPKGMAKVTHNMTLTRLLRNGLTYSRLISFFESAQNTLDFYDKLKDIGIERKASKSLASHLLTMGYCCRGAIESEQRIEIGETKEDIELDTDTPKNGIFLYFYKEKFKP